jgi:cholesterol transport system auxiliary component
MEKRMTGTMRRTVAVLATLLVAACSGSLLPGQAPPPKLYDLTPKSTFDASLPTADWQLLVETPIAAAGIDTSRIALKRSPTTLDYFASAEWTDRAPALVQTLIIESFENSKKIIAVGRESVALRSDYSLKLELREFQADYFTTNDKPIEGANAAPIVDVRINAKLVKMPERTIIASDTFSEKIDAASNTLNDIVLAFDEALGKVLKHAVSWTLTTVDDYEKNEAKRRS